MEKKKPNRKRNVHIDFCVTQTEKDIIKQKMNLVKMNNMGEYLRKMAIFGGVKNVELTALNEISKNFYNMSNNINQIAKRVNFSDSIYKHDIRNILDTLGTSKELMDKIWQLLV